MKIRALPLAAALSVCCYSYSYSDVINGVTGNAAANGFNWDMSNVLPSQSGLTVGGLAYRYTIEKQREDEFTVTIQNEDKINGGYVLQYTDDWSGFNGNTITKQFPLPQIGIERIGNGSIVTEGQGTVLNPDVRYTYRYDECADVLSNPDCPGWAEAYLAWLIENGLISLENQNDDYEDEVEDDYIREMLARSLERQEVVIEENIEELEEKEEEDKQFQRLLSIAKQTVTLGDAKAQEAMLAALSQEGKLDLYSKREISGGEYIETVELQDKKINDNRSAAVRMGLAQDLVHEEMVSSQYK